MGISCVALSVLVTISPQASADAPRTLRAGNDAELARALADVRPGDTIVLADGTYREPLLVKTSGDGPDRPITVKAEHTHRAVFTRKGQAARIDGSFLRFGGLVFDSEYGNCTCVRAAGRDIRFLTCEIRRPGSVDGKGGGDGLQFFDSSDCLVEDCWVHHCLSTRDGERFDSHGIRFTHSHDMVVRNTVIDLVSGDCVQVDPNRKAWDNILIEGCTLSGGKVRADDRYPHPGFPAGGYTAENAIDTKCAGTGRPRITIRACDVYGFRGPIGNAAAFNIKEACEAVIDRCGVHDSVIGLRLRGPAHVRVTNCVLYDNDTHCRYEDHIPHLHIVHCTFGRATSGGHGAFQEQRPSPDLRVLACLFLGDKPRQAGDASNRGVGTAAFADVRKGDYRLAAPIPIGGDGFAPDYVEVKLDRGGVPRPSGGRADAGAHQFRSK